MATSTSPGKRLLRSKSGLRIVPMSESDRSPFELKEPEWIPDKQSPTCMDCEDKFDFLKRRHHCRRCGRVCCASCCDTRMELPRMCFLDPVRLCSTCVTPTLKEKTFFNHDLKILMTGAILYLAGDNPSLVHCCLSPDQRFLVLSSNCNSPDPPTCIPLHRLTSLQLERRDQQKVFNSLRNIPAPGAVRVRVQTEAVQVSRECGVPQVEAGEGDIKDVGLFPYGWGEESLRYWPMEETCDGSLVSGLSVQYCLAGEEGREITLEPPQDATTTAYTFLAALEKAVFMMQESRDIIGTGE
ncbi:Zinc finger FYVE domain-containing protein 21 [Chionoecetes opilio]|uniref:Zinc finger FYVE domain-containing protein 21 n=1 Tax=Chionoecetes opilio TaxID=41210 RepID=A0A8J5CYX1_CHIOP|nr:Zinc finger FYVE domain-containing protein 21 [Chionoecetes opilio]